MIWHLFHMDDAFQAVQSQVRIAGIFAPTRMPAMTLVGVPVPPLPAITDSITGSNAVLAVRAGRRAVADNPLHDDSYFYLFQAYQWLQRMENYVAEVRNPVREFQLISMLRHSALLRSDESGRHLELARYYVGHNLPDLAFFHFRQFTQVVRDIGPPPGATVEDLERAITAQGDQLFRQRLDRAESQLSVMEANYKQRAAITPDPIDRADQAMKLRLAIPALENLVQAVNLMPPTGPRNLRDAQRENPAFQALLDLYILLGYLPEARELLLGRPDASLRLPPAQFHEYVALIATADGHYQLALQHRQELDKLLRGSAVVRAVDGMAMQTLGGRAERFGHSINGMATLFEGLDISARRADQMCHMGLLTLEAGRTQEAADFFRRAVEEIHGESPMRPLAARYYHLITGKQLRVVAE
jgi:hypothetical protein